MTGPQRVLVVDDDPQVRQLMRWALAGRLCRGLPLVDGFAVAEALHALAVPVLMVTADGSAAQKAARMRAFRYLRKPFAIADLIAGVRAGLA